MIIGWVLIVLPEYQTIIYRPIVRYQIIIFRPTVGYQSKPPSISLPLFIENWTGSQGLPSLFIFTSIHRKQDRQLGLPSLFISSSIVRKMIFTKLKYFNMEFIKRMKNEARLKIYAQSAKIILVPPKQEIILGTLTKCSIFLYCESNIGVFSNTPHLVITHLTLLQQKLSLLTSLLHFCIGFVDWFMTSFLHCSMYSYRSFKYCDSDSCCSFSIFKSELVRQLSLSR